MTRTSLFRPEAVEHRRREWLGEVQLIRPVSLTVLTVGAVLVAVVVGVGLALGEYSRKARVTGYLVPDRGVTRLLAPQAATVLESRANEGQVVAAGDVLFVLAVGQSAPGSNTQAAVRDSLVAREQSLRDAARQRTALQQNQLVTLDRQIDDLRREIDSMASETDLQRQRLTLARNAQAQYESLRDENFVSDAQVRAKAEEVLNVTAQLQGLERQRTARLRDVTALLAERRDLPLRARTEHGAIDRDLAVIAQQTAESDARERVVVRAPQAGVLSNVLVATGQAVLPTAALASLLPAGSQLRAHLYAPSSSVGFVRAHQPVQLRYQAFPYQKFGHQRGEVIDVVRAPLQAAELAGLPLAGSAAAAREPLYRITVALDRQDVSAYGQPQPLVSGMQLEADVTLDRRRLIEWLFEPVLGMAGRI